MISPAGSTDGGRWDESSGVVNEAPGLRVPEQLPGAWFQCRAAPHQCVDALWSATSRLELFPATISRFDMVLVRMMSQDVVAVELRSEVA